MSLQLIQMSLLPTNACIVEGILISGKLDPLVSPQNIAKPTMARLTLARKIAAITLSVWKKGGVSTPRASLFVRTASSRVACEGTRPVSSALPWIRTNISVTERLIGGTARCVAFFTAVTSCGTDGHTIEPGYDHTADPSKLTYRWLYGGDRQFLTSRAGYAARRISSNLNGRTNKFGCLTATFKSDRYRAASLI
jgi:hypothetical protein